MRPALSFSDLSVEARLRTGNQVPNRLSVRELLKDKIHYMHIKDALFADGSVVPAGKGDGKVKEILNAYLARGGTAMTVEPHLRVFSGLNQLERKGEESKIGGKYSYPTSDAAFDAACSALKELLA